MSMNDLHKELKRFLISLDRFNEQLSKDWDNLQKQYEDTKQYWRSDDETQRKFESEWLAVTKAIKRYRGRDAEKYKQFLAYRKRMLDEYFGS